MNKTIKRWFYKLSEKSPRVMLIIGIANFIVAMTAMIQFNFYGKQSYL